MQSQDSSPLSTPNTSASPPTIYWLDKQDYIVRVSQSWDDFAQDNDGASVLADAVCGRKLWGFITGDNTKMWVHTVLMMARVKHVPVEKAYRCDSPTERRYMHMIISQAPEDLLQVRHDLIATEPIPQPIHITPATPSLSQSKAFHRCSICGHIYANERWLEPALVSTDLPLKVIYKVCETCQRLLPNPTYHERPSQAPHRTAP